MSGIRAVGGMIVMAMAVSVSMPIRADGTTQNENTVPEATADTVDDELLEEEMFIYETEVHAIRSRRETTRHVLDADAVETLPGTLGDPLNVVKNLPGVAQTGGLGGGLVIRGSEPEDTVYLLDGAVTPMIYHFGDLVSIVDASLIDEIAFYPGNFSVRYGRTTSGVVDLKTRAPRTMGFRAAVSADLFDAGAIAEGAVSPSWSLALSGRRSYIDAVLNSTGLMEDELQFTVAPRYFDFQGTADYHPASGAHLRMTALGADDKMVSGSNLIVDSPTDLRSRLYRLQVNGEHPLGRGMRNEWGLSISYWGVDRTEWDTDTDIHALPIFLEDALTLFGDKPLTLTVGTDTHLGWGKVKESYGDDRPTVEGDRFQAYPALFAELLMTTLPACELVYGVRVDYAEPIEWWSVDPRFTGTCTPFTHTTFKGGLGLFHQPPDLGESDEDLGNPHLKPTSAIHYSVGVEQTLPMYDKLSIDAEFFYKDLRRIVIWSDEWVSYAENLQEGYINGGTGRSFGLEVKITHKPSKRFFGWLAYTLMKAERTDEGASRQRFDYDQRHILTLVGTVRIGWGVSFGARFRLTTGNPYTPIESVIYYSEWDYHMPLHGETNSAELPLFYQLDLRLDKTWEWPNVAFNVYLDVQNATNRQNTTVYNYNESFTERRPTRDLPIIPSLGFRVEYLR